MIGMYYFQIDLLFILIEIMGVTGDNSHNIDKLASLGHILFPSCGIMDEIV